MKHIKLFENFKSDEDIKKDGMKLSNIKLEARASATEFIKKLKVSGGHLMRKIKTVDGKTMIYYREYGSSPTDIKTKVF